MTVRKGRLVKVLSIFRHATDGRGDSHGFFEGGTESATPFEGSTSRKIAMKIPGASRSIGRGERPGNLAPESSERYPCVYLRMEDVSLAN